MGTIRVAEKPFGRLLAAVTALSLLAVASPACTSSAHSNCQLPVVLDNKPGLVTIPGGKFDAEQNPPNPSNSYVTYLHPSHRWLSPPGVVAPDEGALAYADHLPAEASANPSVSRFSLVIVNGQSGTARRFPMPSSIGILAWTTRGIFIQMARDLILVDPTNGSRQTLRSGAFPIGSPAFGLDGTTVWMWSSSGIHSDPEFDELLTEDLSGGPVRRVFTAPTTKFIQAPVGFDSRGHVVFEMRTYFDSGPPSPVEAWVLTNAGPKVLFDGTDINLQPPFTAWDSSGVWFGSWNGRIYRYQADTGLQLAANLDRSLFPPERPDDNPSWLNGREQQQVVIAGSCR